MILAGLTLIAYAGAVIVEAIAGGLLTGVLAERKRERTIEGMHDHYVICGYGRVGRRIAEEFRAAGVPYVVLDYSEEAIAAAKEHGDLLLAGNATRDEDLEHAGIERARGLVVASDSDADNLYIVLSARSMRPELQIVARAADDDAAKKLRLAGADRVVLPYATAGSTMANLVLRPQVTAFLDAVTTATGPDLHLAEIEVHRTCAQAGKTIRDIRVRHETGAIIIALRKRDGSFDTTPEPDVAIEPGRRHRRRRDDRRAAAARGPVRGCRLIPSTARRVARPRRRAGAAGDVAHGDFATNAALKLARARRRPPRELAAELADHAETLPAGRARGDRRPGLRQPLPRRRRGSSARSASILDAAGAFGGSSDAHAQRIQVEMVSANPTGPLHVAHARNGAYGDAVARLLEFAGDGVSASTTTTTRAGRWTGSARRSTPCGAARSRPRTATAATTSASSRSSRATRSRRCSAASRRRSSASASTSTAGRCRASSSSGCPSCSRGSTRTRRTARSGHGRPRTATRRTASSSARASGRRRTAPPTSRISSTSSSAASTARSTCSAPTTTARATGTPPSRGCSATTPTASRCSSTSSSI